MHSLHATPSGRHALLLHLSAAGLRGALAARADSGWRILRATTAESPWPEGLASLCLALDLPRDCRHALVADDTARPLLLDLSPLPGATPAQTREMLRWETDAALAAHSAPDAAPESPGHGDWEIGHVAGHRRTAVAATRLPRLERIRQELQTRGLELAGLASPHALAWHLLSRQDGRAQLSAALVHDAGETVSLSVFERGQLEFFALYDNPFASGGWPSGLLADARSFSLQRLALTPGSPPPAAAPAGLPAAELLPAPDAASDWLWTALLASCDPDAAFPAPLQPAPVVACLERPAPVWQRPAAWWAAAAALALLATLACTLTWTRRLGALRTEHAQVEQQTREIVDRLAYFEQDARHYEQLQAALALVERDIAAVRRDNAKPGAAPCSRVDYLVDSLDALSRTFARGVRLDRFVTDYQGNLALGGTAARDSLAQDAMGVFYAAMKHHPVQPVRLTTTRQAGGGSRVDFIAQNDAARPVAIPVAPPPLPLPSPALAATPAALDVESHP